MYSFTAGSDAELCIVEQKYTWQPVLAEILIMQASN